MRILTKPAAVGVALALLLAPTACSSGSKTTAAAPVTPATSGGASSVAPSATSTSISSSAPGGGSASELDACTLLTTAEASTLGGKQFSAAASKTIARGQDQCTYTAGDNSSSLIIIVYQPSSGVSWQMMTSVLSGSGAVTNVSGVGDKAMVGQIELDAQAGTRLVAIQGAGGNLTGDNSKAIAIAKAVIAALP